MWQIYYVFKLKNKLKWKNILKTLFLDKIAMLKIRLWIINYKFWIINFLIINILYYNFIIQAFLKYNFIWKQNEF